ncbi:sensor histidine kinase [Gorillibacterium timonense]|uniref:sensor histidine kinase n=1 Tax=Gorillibacterium timonense TaxID=1689269 RepID=UPI00071C408F|nr:HAMP domain-containing sensor histidine kinase [Gorillibacterium timonense]
MRLTKLGLRLGLAMLSLLMVIILLLGLTIDRMFATFYEAEMKTELDELASHFISMASSGEVDLAHSLDTFAEFSDVTLIEVDNSGRSVLHSGSHDPGDLTFIRSEDLTSIQAGESIRFFHRTAGGERFLVAGQPFDAPGKERTALYVLSSTRHMDESLHAIRNLLGFSAAGAILLALGLIWILAGALTRPLVTMQQATRRIAVGRLETRIEAERRDEMGDLARAINEMASELERNRDTKQEFFATISHELRTPITYLEGYSRVLQEGLYDNEEERDHYLTIVRQEANRLHRLVDDLFELSRMEEGNLDITLERVDLNGLAVKTAERIGNRARDKGLSVKLLLSGEPILIQGDPQRMEQVLLNLAENAIRYTERGEIRFRVAVELNATALLAVEDTGIGIAPEELPYLFERFYRVEKSRSREYGGSGIGLALVKQMTELQGGTVHVDSVPGEGSRFELRFPRLREQEGDPQ